MKSDAARIRPELRPEVLLTAYANGLFPMPDPDNPRELLWFSPDPRGLLPLDGRFHVSRRLRRTIRQGRFACTLDRAFGAVMRACAQRKEGTWITKEFVSAYGLLHAGGAAHSVEAWAVEPRARGDANWPNDSARSGPPRPATPGGAAAAGSPSPLDIEVRWAEAGDVRPEQLVGGVYGVAIGGAFFAESMFHRVTDAGKAALAGLVQHLCRRGFLLCDLQWTTPNLKRFGAFDLPRKEYLRRLRKAIAANAQFASDRK